MANKVDLGAVIFERYLRAREYSIEAREEDYGTGKRPDYRIRACGHDVVVELKTFDPVTARPSIGGVGQAPRVNAVRERIRAAAEQLKGVVDRPVVALLASPLDGLSVPLHPGGVVEAMWGDLGVSFNEDGAYFASSRNGRLHVKDPDGGVRGFHRHLSAVAVVRLAAGLEPEMFVERAVARKLGSIGEKASFVAALEAIELESSCRELVELDVFETVSSDAVPLPREVFAGPGDTRWGVIGSGPRYGLLSSPILPGNGG